MLLALLAVLTLFAACGKKKEAELDPNAVLTDSDIPLDLGAELIEDDTDPLANPSHVIIQATPDDDQYSSNEPMSSVSLQPMQ